MKKGRYLMSLGAPLRQVGRDGVQTPEVQVGVVAAFHPAGPRRGAGPPSYPGERLAQVKTLEIPRRSCLSRPR